MNEFRVFLSVTIFSVSVYLLIDLFITGFDFFVLSGSLIGFFIAHYLWPQHKEDESAWYDLLEVVIYLPFRCISLFFRGIGRIFKGADAGVDIDF